MSTQKARNHFSHAVASRIDSGGEARAIAEWIAIVLPILQAFGCLPATATPADKQKWIATHKGQARATAIRELKRSAPERLKRRQVRDIATEMVNRAVEMSPEQFAEMCE